MEKLQKKKWLFLIAAAVFLVIWAVLGITSRSSGPEALVKKYLKACEKQNVNKIVKCYAPELREEMQKELKESFADELQNALLDKMDYKLIVGDVVYGKEKNTAEVSYAMVLDITGGGEMLSGADFETLSLVKVGNKWYIGE